MVHRRRHGDWTLPKGKLNPGECFPEAAIREVREETGCVGQLGEYIGAIGYEVDLAPKVVLFWRMSASGENALTDHEEVAETRWMSVPDAIDQLSHSHERDLLRGVSVVGDRTYQKPKDLLLKSWSRRWSWSRGGRAYARLLREFEAFRVELAFLEQRSHREDSSWVGAAKDQLDNVHRYLQTRDIEGGWYCLHAAQRLALFGLNGSEIKNRAQILRGESRKISSWRALAMNDLLDVARGELTVDRLVDATALRDEYAANQYHKIWLMADQLGVLFWLSLASILIFLGALQLLRRETADWSVPLVVTVVTVGILGASFSAAQSLITNSAQGRIPERVANHYVTIIRALFGATAGLAGYMFLRSGLFKIAATEQPGLGISLAIAFLFGYAGERLIAGIAASVGKSEGGPERDSKS